MKSTYMVAPQRIELSIPSKLQYVDDILQIVERRLEGSGFSRRFINDIWLGLREALVNAIVHGNKNDPNKKVVIQANINFDFAKFKIADEGDEDVYTLFSEPEKMDKFLKNKGQRLCLIRHVMDMVCFNQTGNEIVMIKKAHKGSVN